MKCKLVLDQDAVPSAASDEQLKQIRYVARKRYPKPVAIYPKGTEFEGPDALGFVLRGQAEPSDAECLEACGMSQAERKAVQVQYELTHSGFNSDQDRDLALAGVISGFDEKGNPIPGPNYAEYEAARKKILEEANDE